jgi:hypothetical protein
MARILLIYCEGKTEKLYFEILAKRIFRIPMYVRVDIYGEKGQHKALVDRAAAARSMLANDEGLNESEIECWAVCDDDNMPYSYKELLEHAEQNNVYLAFSRPQFESYLLQHFEQSKATKKKDLFSGLSKYKKPIDGEGYNESAKGNLDWLEKLLIDKPKLIDAAIINSNQRSRQSEEPFLTVQDLTKRLKELERD